MEAAKTCKRRVSISGMLKFLGVSRSGYRAFLNRKLSPTRQRKDAVKKEIQRIYDDSKQNYGAPQIAKKLRDSGETISTRTVGKYMHEMGIRAQWVNPGRLQHVISTLAANCTMSLTNNSIQNGPTPSGALI